MFWNKFSDKISYLLYFLEVSGVLVCYSKWEPFRQDLQWLLKL